MASLVTLAVLTILRLVAAKSSLALQGGGIRALASDAGLVAGIARVKSMMAGAGGAVNVAEVLQHFDSVSSVSGSSWFAAELFFSSSFVEMLTGL